MVNRRQYVRTVGSGLCVGLAGLAGCGSPSEEGGTASPVGGANETATETAVEEQTETTEPTETPEETEAGAEGAEGGENTVAMVSEDDQHYFDPIGVFVESGASITWENQSGSHSSTAYVEDNPQAGVRRVPEDSDGWNSETLSEEGATFSHTFEVEGTYDYYCIPHKSLGMVGRVVVGEPSGLGDDPPDGSVPDEQTIVEEGTVSHDAFNSG